MPSQPLDGLKISSRVTLLEPGMYIFRFASQPPADKPVCIALQQAPLGKGSIDFFPAEGISKNMLTKLGDTIVARVKGGVTTVLITEYHMFDDVIEPVDLRIDRIDTSPAIMRTFAVVATEPTPALAKTAIPPFELTAHMQRGGEVVSSEGWVGSPGSDDFIESFAINWLNKPAGVDLLYTCMVAGSGPSRNVSTGTFVGLRGEGLPLICAGFSLVGPQRKHYELSGHIVFGNAEPQRLVTNQMMHGPTGTEPLVALHIALTPVTKMNAARSKSPWENSAFQQKISTASQLA
ncbi:hypothetical protein V0R52_18460 [Pseudomonas asiatica]|uniref:hypothetical protein n=1 Tax=Pseudomonas TaxID=286 RepID=UPI002E7AB2EE|nr:hypothetical protein [Pseudomonas asiatica]MEE1918376.1 hypothetical protein [Pseudomonas asiatica]